jgi:hypothetical protein
MQQMTAAHDRQHALKILERCLQLVGNEELESGRTQRLDELLADFKLQDKSARAPVECASGWRFCVPSAFRAALDIKLTPRTENGSTVMKWTQGSRFHFEQGHTLYDSAKAYRPWDLRNFQVCLDVQRAAPAQPPNSGDRGARDAGTVIFDVLTPDEQGAQLVKRHEEAMSQDDFVRLLIVGPPAAWSDFRS